MSAHGQSILIDRAEKTSSMPRASAAGRFRCNCEASQRRRTAGRTRASRSTFVHRTTRARENYENNERKERDETSSQSPQPSGLPRLWHSARHAGRRRCNARRHTPLSTVLTRARENYSSGRRGQCAKCCRISVAGKRSSLPPTLIIARPTTSSGPAGTVAEATRITQGFERSKCCGAVAKA